LANASILEHQTLEMFADIIAVVV